MKLIQPSVKFIFNGPTGEMAYKLIEEMGRTCYKSEDKITEESAALFVRQLIKRGHFSVLEHVSATMKFIEDRGVSHELVRHRIASYSQESTRYCNYGKANEISVINIISLLADNIQSLMPDGSTESVAEAINEVVEIWMEAMSQAELAYMKLIKLGIRPEIARGVLPTNVKTEVNMTCNLRQWREVFRQRSFYNKAAHPQMRIIMTEAFTIMYNLFPEIFDDMVDTVYTNLKQCSTVLADNYKKHLKGVSHE
jgi:thymidylate synthase (FAD)